VLSCEKARRKTWESRHKTTLPFFNIGDAALVEGAARQIEAIVDELGARFESNEAMEQLTAPAQGCPERAAANSVRLDHGRNCHSHAADH
jgi:hypothetical protein